MTSQIRKPMPLLSAGRIAAIAVSSFGGATFGYDLGAISASTRELVAALHLSTAQLGVAVSASLWGGAVGSFLGGKLVDNFGRRALFSSCATLYGMAALGLGIAPVSSWTALLALRFLCGVAIGGFVVVCPLYLAEIAPRMSRGRIVGCFQLQIGAGVVLAFATSALLAGRFAHANWRWCLGLGAVPSVLQLALLRWMPEVPQWLEQTLGRRDEAERMARRLGMAMVEWRSADATPAVAPRHAIRSLFHKQYLRPILLAGGIAMFNQLTGVNIFRMYLLDLLSSAGVRAQASYGYAISISLLNIVFTLMALLLVDVRGRKPLLIAGSGAMAVSLVWLAISLQHHTDARVYELVLSVFNASFAFSQGPMIWIYLSELFPLPVRGAGQALGSLVHWITSALVILSFPVLHRAMSNGVFLIFAGIVCSQIAVVALWYPETKGIALGNLEPRHRSNS
jgi:sugar porter (SP) family MFS transporter